MTLIASSGIFLPSTLTAAWSYLPLLNHLSYPILNFRQLSNYTTQKQTQPPFLLLGIRCSVVRTGNCTLIQRAVEAMGFGERKTP